MAAALDERDAPAAPPQRQRGQRSGEPGADDGDVGVDRESTGMSVMPQPACTAVARMVAAASRCSRFIACRRSRRALEAGGAVRRTARDPRGPRRPGREPGACVSASAKLRSMSSSAGGAERALRGQRLHRAVAGRASESATRPRRRSRTPRRPIAAASRPARRAARTAARSAGTPAAPRRGAASARPRRANWSSVIRLFSRSSASGCAVSSPIATSSCGRRVARRDARSSASSKRSTRGPTSAGCDSTTTARQPGERRGDRRRSPLSGTARGSKKLPAL